MNSVPVLASLLPLTVYVMFVPSSQLSAYLPGVCFSTSRPSPHRQLSPSLSPLSQAAALTHTLPFRSRVVRVLAGEEVLSQHRHPQAAHVNRNCRQQLSYPLASILSPVSEKLAPSGTNQNRADVIVRFLIRLELQKNTGSYSFKFVGVCVILLLSWLLLTLRQPL